MKPTTIGLDTAPHRMTVRRQTAMPDHAILTHDRGDPLPGRTGVSRMWGDVDAGDMTSRSVVGWGLADGVGLAFG